MFDASTPCLLQVETSGCRGSSLEGEDERPLAVWIERDGWAVLTFAGPAHFAWEEPESVEVRLPDGRVLVVRAATLCVRFEWHEGRWEPCGIRGARIRSVILDRKRIA